MLASGLFLRLLASGTVKDRSSLTLCPIPWVASASYVVKDVILHYWPASLACIVGSVKLDMGKW